MVFYTTDRQKKVTYFKLKNNNMFKLYRTKEEFIERCNHFIDKRRSVLEGVEYAKEILQEHLTEPFTQEIVAMLNGEKDKKVKFSYMKIDDVLKLLILTNEGWFSDEFSAAILLQVATKEDNTIKLPIFADETKIYKLQADLTRYYDMIDCFDKYMEKAAEFEEAMNVYIRDVPEDVRKNITFDNYFQLMQ
jgi:DNA-binding MarR family transcriptional regulator